MIGAMVKAECVNRDSSKGVRSRQKNTAMEPLAVWVNGSHDREPKEHCEGGIANRI
jgi:hypothetical protein